MLNWERLQLVRMGERYLNWAGDVFKSLLGEQIQLSDVQKEQLKVALNDLETVKVMLKKLAK